MSAEHILIVDDDLEVHDLVRSMLQDTNRTMESALNGEEALCVETATPADLVGYGAPGVIRTPDLLVRSQLASPNSLITGVRFSQENAL